METFPWDYAIVIFAIDRKNNPPSAKVAYK